MHYVTNKLVFKQMYLECTPKKNKGNVQTF